MSLTRKLLRELNLEDAQIERVILAHMETVDALRAERDALQKEQSALLTEVAELTPHREAAARIQADFDAYRAQVDADRLATARQAALRAALLDAGANPLTVDLLSAAAPIPDDAFDGPALRDPAAALAPIRTRYAALFARPVDLPTARLSPPCDAAAPLSRDDVARMSEQEILANWPTVQAALKGTTGT